MSAISRIGLPTLLATLLIALILTIIPVPARIDAFRPDWVALVLIYWALAEPRRVGLGWAWVAGLLLDALKGALLGQHALALILVAFLTLKLHLRIRVFPMLQQTLTVAVLIGVYQFTLLWIDGAAGVPIGGPERWAPVVASLFFWPVVSGILGLLRMRAGHG